MTSPEVILKQIFDQTKDSTKIVANDKFMGDDGAAILAQLLSQHKNAQILQLKSNDITAEGFKLIFESIQKNPNLKHLNVEYNNLGQDQYSDWQDAFYAALHSCPKLERINLSNNKMSNDQFTRIIRSLAQCPNLKLLELRYNNIETSAIQTLVNQLKETNNRSLLFVQLAGNKIKKEVLDQLEAILKNNRKKNPITKEKILSLAGNIIQPNQNQNKNSGFQKLQHKNIEDSNLSNLSRQNIIAQLQQILNQNRQQTAQIKARLERQLDELQRRQKNDAHELHQLDTKCNELTIQNRNLKFQLDRTLSEHQQIQRDQQYHRRVHEEKLRQANKQLMDLQGKYLQIQSRMIKQHQSKMKQIARDWQNRLRSVQQKIRIVQGENHTYDQQIRKLVDKRQKIKMEYMDQQNHIRTKVDEQQTQRYQMKLSALQSKLRQIQQTRQQFLKRNQDLLYQIEKTQSANAKNIEQLEQQSRLLKGQQEQFIRKNKQFISKNQKIKGDLKIKEISIQKLEEQINRLNEQIEEKKGFNRQQIDKIIHESEYQRKKGQQEKQLQINKMNQLEAQLRVAQTQNAKLRQQYNILAQRLQVGVGKAVMDVFQTNNLH